MQEPYPVHVGKEANKLEEVEAGLEHDPDEVWTEYRDPGRDPWATLVLPVLWQMPIDRLVAKPGLHRRSLFATRAGERRPHPRNRQALLAAAGAFTNERLRDSALGPSLEDLSAICAPWCSSSACCSVSCCSCNPCSSTGSPMRRMKQRSRGALWWRCSGSFLWFAPDQFRYHHRFPPLDRCNTGVDRGEAPDVVQGSGLRWLTGQDGVAERQQRAGTVLGGQVT